MTDTSPSPFRRFPWVQLGFCLACLSMSAWTWMRYSFAWSVTPSDITREEFLVVRACQEGKTPEHSLVGRYACVRGNRRLVKDGSLHVERTTSSGHEYARVWLGESAHDWRGMPIPVTAFGRVRLLDEIRASGIRHLAVWVDGTASRFHPASVAGLVVGAMGCFIFGLYLRRWLRERKVAFTTEHTEVTENGTR